MMSPDIIICPQSADKICKYKNYHIAKEGGI